jgi:hypothetical protein
LCSVCLFLVFVFIIVFVLSLFCVVVDPVICFKLLAIVLVLCCLVLLFGHYVCYWFLFVHVFFVVHCVLCPLFSVFVRGRMFIGLFVLAGLSIVWKRIFAGHPPNMNNNAEE